MLILGVFGFIGDSVQEMIVGLFLLIDSLVYSIISWFYQLFCILASFRIFDNSMYESITESVYSIIGIVSLFILSYQLLNMLVHAGENKNSTSEIKKIVINIVTSMLMIIMVPTVFSFMFDVQNSILGYNVIGKIFLPKSNFSNIQNLTINYLDAEGNELQMSGNLSEVSKKIDEKTYNSYLLTYYGNSTATQIFQAFFYPSNATVKDFEKQAANIQTSGSGTEWYVKVAAYGSCGLTLAAAGGITFATALIGSPSFGAAAAYCAAAIGIERASDYILDITSDKYSLLDAYNYSAAFGDFNVFQPFAESIIDNEITYHYIISTIMGLIVCYIIALYCIDLGVRSVKLAFFQIFAPLPIFLRIIPKQEKIFSSYVKAVLSTYFEVFTRMMILYLAVFLISNIPNIMGNIFASNSTPYVTNNLLIYLLVRVIIILGILIFVKQAPKIIEEITGIKSGNFSLNFMDHIKEAAWAPAAIGGLITGHTPMAMFRAGAAGWRNNNLQGVGAEATRRRNRLIANEEAERAGLDVVERNLQRVRERGRAMLGLESSVDVMNRRLDEGYDPRTGNVIRATNDTRNSIDIRDENGHVISTINIGDSLSMDRMTQEQIETTRKANAIDLSEIAEILRNIQNSEKSNESLISLRSALKKEAEEKVAEEKSTITDTITTGFGTFTGNLASMFEYREQRKLNGASEEELKQITEAIGAAKDRMWENYANQAINGGGTVSNEKIRNISDQMSLLFSQGALQSASGVSYDTRADSRGLNGLSGLDLVNALDSAAKEYNNNLVLERQRESSNQSRIQEQNAGLDRLTAQLKEQQEQAKQSNAYRAATTTSNYVRQNNGNNRS